MLGLAFSQRSIIVAEVAMQAGRLVVRRGAQLPLDEGMFSADPQAAQAAGQSLRSLLQQHHVRCRRCVIGLEAWWMLAIPKLLPPCAQAELPSVLSIEAERSFVTSSKFAFDFTGTASPEAPSHLLLLGALRSMMERTQMIAQAAGLSVTAVSSSPLVLAEASSSQAADRAVLSLHSDRAELVMYHQHQTIAIRRAATGKPQDAQQLASELRRAMAASPSGPADPAGEVIVWDSIGVDRGWLDDIGQQLGMPVRLGRFPEDAGLAVLDPSLAKSQFAQAAALAAGGLNGSLPADFLHLKLSGPAVHPLRRRIAWAAAAVAVVLAAAVYSAIDWHTSQADLAAMQSRLDGMEGRVEQAQRVVDTVTYARGWYDQRPRILDCLLEVTSAFPQGPGIWATNLSVREDAKVLLTGKCQDGAALMTLLDRLRASGRFVNIQPLYMRQGEGNSPDVSFAVTFEFPGLQ